MLQRALASVAGQTFRDFLWVIVNDGGDPAEVDAVVDKAAGAGLTARALHRRDSRGMEAASNAGIRACASELIAIHDDDDSWEPAFLAETVQFLDSHPGMVGVITHATAIRERVRKDRIETVRRLPHQPLLKAVHLADMARANLFPPISLVYRRSAFRKLKGYDQSMEVLGDWDFNLRLLMLGDIGVIPKPLANYHVRAGPAPAESAYANSVSARLDAHHAMDAAYRNRRLREDLLEGRPGLGFLLAMGRLQVRPARSRSTGRQALNALFGRIIAPGKDQD
jgi:glycosyltransferase involved in cell wall biosynthesis